MKNATIAEWLAYGILLALAIFSVIHTAIPFWHNALQNVDAPGHLAVARYIHDFLWPSPIGWTHSFFGGHPINQFYSPLVSWTIATLAFILPITVIFKGVIIAAVLLTPLSVYYCARKFHYPPLWAAVVALTVFALLSVRYETFLGSEFYSIFTYGLASNGVATPLLFFYMGLCVSEMQKGKYLGPSLVLSLLSLTHIILGLCGWIFLTSYALTNGQQFRRIVKHAIVSVLLIGFWLVPFIAKFWLTDSESGAVTFITLGFVSVVVLIGAAISIWYLVVMKRDSHMEPIVVFFSLLLAIFFINMVARIPIQLYRLYLLILILAAFIIIRAIQKYGYPVLTVAPIVFSLFLIATNINTVDYDGPSPLTINRFEPTDGRVIVTFLTPSWHTVGTLLSDHHLVARGLFSESAASSKFYIEVQDELLDQESRRNIDAKLRTFGVNWLASDTPHAMNYTERRFLTIYEGRIVWLYRIANTSLVEVLNYTPTVVRGNWKSHTQTWYDSMNPQRIVAITDYLPPSIGEDIHSAHLVNLSPNRIRIHVNATYDVPVFLKLSYFPNWKAYSNGDPLHIYHVLPSFMLLYGHGDIVLRYEPIWSDKVGLLLSIVGVAWLLLLFKGDQNG